MNAAIKLIEKQSLLRSASSDTWLITLALAQGGLLLALPVLPVLALGLWWNANTISHNFIHRPFFRSARLNRLFSTYLSLLLGWPQSLWRERHLAHHAGRNWSWRINRQAGLELIAVLLLWLGLLAFAPGFFLTVYAPGYAIGLGLCYLQGHYEHARGPVSHYGRVYNWLFFNDGYHVEHHTAPALPWPQLALKRHPQAQTSRWPAVLRWLEIFSLVALERLALRSTWLQWFMVRTHEQAFRRLLSELGPLKRIAIVGGGLFPRTVLILRRLRPEVQLIVIDAQAESLSCAQAYLARHSPAPVEFRHEWYAPERHDDFDLLIIPLSFMGDRAAFYRQAGSTPVLVHDWLWRRCDRSQIISLLLLKRLNLVMR